MSMPVKKYRHTYGYMVKTFLLSMLVKGFNSFLNSYIVQTCLVSCWQIKFFSLNINNVD